MTGFTWRRLSYAEARRIFRIFFAFPEERQKVITLFEKTDWTNSGKSLAYSRLLFSRLWAGLCFLSLFWRLRKIKNPKNPVHPVDNY